MFKFKDYTYEIFTVGQALTKDGYFCDVDEAFVRFKADVMAGEALEYNTGAALPEFDFAGAHAEYAMLTPDEQVSAIRAYNDFVAENYAALCKAFGEGKDAMLALVG